MKSLLQRHLLAVTALTSVALAAPLATPAYAAASPAVKREVSADIDGRAKLVQEMVDSIYSFAEPGFQEFKTQEYITTILEQQGFTIEKGVAGIPSAWTATWTHGSGGPKIALGSDVDGLLGLSQVPGSPELKPQVEGAPGHGEGHNSGMPLIVAAALATKDAMQKHNISGTLMIWPGIAEELLATKAFFVREGLFDDVDACIFTHVGNRLGTSWGDNGGNGMVSVEYTFSGQTSHSAGAPWMGRSALDAVEIMNTAWNFRREHLYPTQRSHYVITQGGGQPNIVPDKASVWYYFREREFPSIRALYETGNRISQAAAMATDTTVESRILGYAAPNHGNRPMAEAAQLNIQTVGMPTWTEADQAFARAAQVANNRPITPLATEVAPLRGPIEGVSLGGGSDDIGDIMWKVPTITIGFPSNIPSMIGHHTTAAIAMATPIAHKGAVTGAKAVAMTVLDLLTTPQLLTEAKKYQQEVQFASATYDPVLTPETQPAIHLNTEVMERLRPKLEPLYYDPSKYASYLEQLGIPYPPAPVAGN
ncbi:amidohydrolase [Altererythrobacter xixiisoli]|uniref:Amidohydrolase n=1 Tax=Croceibacterium xixiisoli TaxID=1476466 RepID=A0A6I4TXK9_9SPHN|nr:amidohydrolase [Croceibacterium xixiisoli]MXP00767.1 amidohydrolase [Croceibacterium xixiisoli]